VILLSSVAAFAAPCGKITHVEGRVDVLRPGKNLAIEVSLGDPVEVGDIYRAKTLSKAEATFLNGNVLRIGPATRVEIKEYMVEGGKSSNVVKLYRGRVQAVSAEDLAKKIVAFAEGRKFEVHTENAVAGVRDTNMLVEAEGGTTTVILLSGEGYLYNPQRPQKIVRLTSGYVSTVSGSGGPPTQPKPASDIRIRSFIQQVTPSTSAGGPSGTSGMGTPPGSGGEPGAPGPGASGTEADPPSPDSAPPAGPVPTPPLPTDPVNAPQLLSPLAPFFFPPNVQPLPPPVTLPPTAAAVSQPNYWVGGNGIWTDGTKWSLGSPPSAGNNVLLASDAGTVIYNAASTAGFGSVTIGSTGGGPVCLSIGQGVFASRGLTVGQFGPGSLDLCGGSVTSPRIVLGMTDGSTGTSSQSGGSVSVGSLYLGYNPGSGGSYTLANGYLSVTGNAYLGYGGSGSFYQCGGAVTVNNDLAIGSKGSCDFEGGKLQVGGYLFNNGSLTVNGSSLNGDLFQVGTLMQAGRLQGSGTITGNVDVTGGTVYPGNAPGVLTIAGSYAQSAGTLNIDILGKGNYSQLNVTGTASVEGYLHVVLLSGASISNNDSFDIFHAALLTGTLSPENNDPLFIGTNNFYFTLDPTSTDIFLIAHGNWSSEGASSVPLPPGMLLLAPGLVGLAAIRRRLTFLWPST
jgi:hypothetical protein